MTKLIKIGSSYGVRIPKTLIDKAHLRDCDIDLTLLKKGLLLSPKNNFRSSWDNETLRKKAKQEINNTIQEEFACADLKEWEW